MPVSRKTSIVYGALRALAYSNTWISLEAFFIAFVTIILAGFNLAFTPLLVAFAAFFVIYTMDRYLGMEEDEENMPIRTNFMRKYGYFLFVLSIAGYITALAVSLAHNFWMFAFTVIPVFLSIIYSPLNLKKFLYIGNSIVGVAWGTVPLIVGAYYGQILSAEVLFLSAVFTLSWFRNATIFDIKDIRGDLKEGVKTIPNTYGLENTKLLAISINILLMVSWILLIFLGFLGLEFLVLLGFHAYIFVYAQLLNGNRGELYYSIIIDGECKFLGLCVFIATLTGAI